MKKLSKERLEEITKHTKELAAIGAVGFLTQDAPGAVSQSSVGEALALLHHISFLESELAEKEAENERLRAAIKANCALCIGDCRDDMGRNQCALAALEKTANGITVEGE